MHKRVVGGFVYPNGKGIALPPELTVGKGLEGESSFVTIAVHSRTVSKDTQENEKLI